MKSTAALSLSILLTFSLLASPFVCAATAEPTPAPTTAPQVTTTESVPAAIVKESRFGLSYFTFFNGPGLTEDSLTFTPNVLGKPDDDGLRTTNFISLKYKINPRWAVDLQMRVQWVFNNAKEVEDFEPFRWQSPRVGISGKILSGKDWSLTGAINTDFPYFFPEPIGGGFVASKRTTLANPGLFAKFSYMPSGSRWSVFSLVMPRMFFYRDRSAAEPQLSRAGYSPELKNEFTLSLSPSINYAFTQKTGMRLGTELTYSKLVLSGWNPFNGSLNGSDIQSKAWRLAAVPLQLGVTHEFHPAFSVSAFAQAYPIAAQRVRRDGSSADFIQTASIGMWISGTVL